MNKNSTRKTYHSPSIRKNIRDFANMWVVFTNMGGIGWNDVMSFRSRREARNYILASPYDVQYKLVKYQQQTGLPYEGIY